MTSIRLGSCPLLQPSSWWTSKKQRFVQRGTWHRRRSRSKTRRRTFAGTARVTTFSGSRRSWTSPEQRAASTAARSTGTGPSRLSLVASPQPPHSVMTTRGVTLSPSVSPAPSRRANTACPASDRLSRSWTSAMTWSKRATCSGVKVRTRVTFSGSPVRSALSWFAVISSDLANHSSSFSGLAILHSSRALVHSARPPRRQPESQGAPCYPPRSRSARRSCSCGVHSDPKPWPKDWSSRRACGARAASPARGRSRSELRSFGARRKGNRAPRGALGPRLGEGTLANRLCQLWDPRPCGPPRESLATSVSPRGRRT